MKNRLTHFVGRITHAGLPLPHAYDPLEKKPSFRLLTAYSSFMLAFASIIMLHWHAELLTASLTAIGFFALNMVFYMLKKLQQARIDLDDREISLSSASNLQETVDTAP